MACCLTAPSHYPDRRWLGEVSCGIHRAISQVVLMNLIRDICSNVMQKMPSPKMAAILSRDRWVDKKLFRDWLMPRHQPIRTTYSARSVLYIQVNHSASQEIRTQFAVSFSALSWCRPILLISFMVISMALMQSNRTAPLPISLP